MAMNPKLMRPKKRGTRRNEIVDIEWTADGGRLYSKPGGQSFDHNAPSWLIEWCLSMDYSGAVSVVDNGSMGNNYRYRVTFQDGQNKNVQLVDNGLYTAQPVIPSVLTVVQGSAEIEGVVEIFRIDRGGATSGTIFFDNDNDGGTLSGQVTYSNGEVVSVVPPDGFSYEGTDTVVFTANSTGHVPNFSQSSHNTDGNPVVFTDQEGVTQYTASQGVQVIDLGGANYGVWGLNNAPDSLSESSTGADVTSYVSSVVGACSVAGDVGGPFTVTFNAFEFVAEMFVNPSHTLEVRSSSAHLISVSVVQQGG